MDVICVVMASKHVPQESATMWAYIYGCIAAVHASITTDHVLCFTVNLTNKTEGFSEDKL